MAPLPTLRTSLAILGAISITSAAAAVLKNITITVPDGTSDHGDPGLICSPTKWTDVVIFFLGNYFAHAATIITSPGESKPSVMLITLFALLFPTSGVYRGVSAILSLSKFAKTDIERAARAGALCMAVRTDEWKPRAGDVVFNSICKVPPSYSQQTQLGERIGHVQVFNAPWGLGRTTQDFVFTPRKDIIYGACKLPLGYQLAIVPMDAEFIVESRDSQSTISSNYSAVKAIVALGQSIYAISTLYDSRGDQLKRYGYAAFGLTVAPYAVMSVVNLLGGLITPQYPYLYLVDSEILDEARKRDGCIVNGTVGRLDELGANVRLDFTSFRKNCFWQCGSIQFGEGESGGELVVGFHARPMAPHPSSESGSQPAFSSPPEPDSAVSIELAPVESNLAEDFEFSVLEDSEVEPKKNPDPNPGQGSSSKKPDSQNSAEIGQNEGQPPGTSRSEEESQPMIGRDLTSYSLFVPNKSAMKRTNSNNTPLKCKIISYDESAYKITTAPSMESRGTRNVMLSIIVSFISLAIIGGLSHFKAGQSTRAQRGWIMAWWLIGVFVGASLFEISDQTMEGNNGNFLFGGLIWAAFFGSAAFGGFVVVGQMLVSYGTCVRIS